MTHIFNILVIASINRFFRLALKKEPQPESLQKELSNFLYTSIGVAVIYFSFLFLMYVIAAFLF